MGSFGSGKQVPITSWYSSIVAKALTASFRVGATRLLVLIIIWMMTPGLTEAAESLWHVIEAGHTAHAPGAGPDHAPEGDEHGCSGAFHLCSCHHTPPSAFALAIGDHEVDPATGGPGPLIRCHGQNPDLPGPYRPPQA